MKRFSFFFAVLALCFTVTATANPAPNKNVAEATTQQWDAFSKNLVKALTSGHQGLQTAAMSRVVQYGDKVNVDEAMFEVMSLYRNHDDDSVRRLAVVTLGKMNSDWAINYLKLAERYEKSTTVRRTIHAVVADYQAAL